MRNVSSKRLGACLLPLVLALSACGGGGDDLSGALPMPPADPVVAGTDVPQSATRSVDEAIAFVRRVVADLGETAEGLVLGDAMLATSETAEPQPL